MNQRGYWAALGVSALALLAGCAQSTPVEGAPTPVAGAEASQSARWTANIQSVTQSRGDVAQTTRDRSYGSATWSVGSGPSLTKVEVVFTYTGTERSLGWAILAGTCGTPALPLIPMSNFPELDIGGGGRAQVTTSLPVQLPSTGTYHIDIYRDRRQTLDALVACGNLRFAGG